MRNEMLILKKIINKIKAIQHGGMQAVKSERIFDDLHADDGKQRIRGKSSERSKARRIRVTRRKRCHGRGGKRRGAGLKRAYDTGYGSFRDALWKTLFIHTSVFEVRTNERQRHDFKNNSEFAKFLS